MHAIMKKQEHEKGGENEGAENTDMHTEVLEIQHQESNTDQPKAEIAKDRLKFGLSLIFVAIILYFLIKLVISLVT